SPVLSLLMTKMKIIHYSIVLLIQVAFVKSDNFKCIKDSTNKTAPWCVNFFAEDPTVGQAAYYTLDPVTNYSKVTGDPYCEFFRGCCKSGVCSIQTSWTHPPRTICRDVYNCETHKKSILLKFLFAFSMSMIVTALN
ncbi:hypothetical protein MJO29_001518, partial [Puccinia striiformis f. sp. tritici]